MRFERQCSLRHQLLLLPGWEYVLVTVGALVSTLRDQPPTLRHGLLSRPAWWFVLVIPIGSAILEQQQGGSDPAMHRDDWPDALIWQAAVLPRHKHLHLPRESEVAIVVRPLVHVTVG